MEKFKKTATEMFRKYAIYAFLAGFVVGAMVARDQVMADNASVKTKIEYAK